MNKELVKSLQNAKEEPCLIFRDGQYLFSAVLENGGRKENYVSDAAVREAFSGIPVDSGWLPPGVARWGTGRLGEWAALFVPPGRHQLEISNDGSGQPYAVERVTAPLPGIVFFGIGTNYYCWAVKTERLDPYHEIYRCPLPNVLQDGSVCWGLVKPPRASARALSQAWQLFITSTFNNHAANGKSKSHRDDVRELLKELAAGDAVFPVNDLKRQTENGVGLDSAVREFFKSGEMPG